MIIDSDSIYDLKGQALDTAVSEIVLEWHVEELDNGYGYPAKYWINKEGENLHPVNFWSPSWRIEQAMIVANFMGIALIPQSREEGKFDWYALDLNSVSYQGDEIILNTRNDSGIVTDRPAESICKAALYSKLNSK